MSVSYDVFTGAFLAKITEYDFIEMQDALRTDIVDGYLKRAVSAFRKNCKYDLFSTGDDVLRAFEVDVKEEDLDELVDIISEGMVMQWMRPYLYKQELLEMGLNTRDFTAYSPSELLHRVGEAYARVKKDYTQLIREYSYNHGDLTRLHI